MLMFVWLKVKLVGRVMPKFEFNLPPPSAKYDLIVFRRFVCKSLTLLNRTFYICLSGINFTLHKKN